MNTPNAILSTCIILLSILFPLHAGAGESSLIINGKSYHINSSYDWNEDNVGIGIEYEFTQKSAWKKTLMANAFRDSTDKMSYMAGAGLHRRLYESDGSSGFYIYAGLNAFLMTREDLRDQEVFPGILPSLSTGTDRFGFNLTYLPRQAVEKITGAEVVDPTIRGIVFVQFKISLAPSNH